MIALEGQTVRLEPLSLEHVPALVEAASVDRSTYAFTPVPDGVEAMHAYVRDALRLRDEGTAVPFAIVIRDTARVVGSTRFGNIEDWDDDGVPDVVEIGWTWLAADTQRTPVNTEAKLLMLTHAFERWRVFRVSLCTDARNLRSRTAIERLGARPDGVLRAQRLAVDGVVRDTAYYSIIASEWPDLKRGLEARLRGS